MYVIIDVHHDNSWIKPMASEAQESADRLSTLWTQVANFFQDYNDSLIFETLNEPRIEGITEEWSGGNSEGRDYINGFHKAAVDAIRATGGNNEKRHIMITFWAESTIPIAMEELTIPNDDEKIIISLHSYFPWQFAGEAAVTWGSARDKSELTAELDKIKQKWIIERNRPVILGEWGTIEANTLQSRINYADFYAQEAAARRLLTIYGMMGVILDCSTAMTSAGTLLILPLLSLLLPNNSQLDPLRSLCKLFEQVNQNLSISR